MKKAETDEYVKAIVDLDTRRSAGDIDPVRWEILRTRLVNEAARPKRPADVSFLIVMGCIVGILAILWVILQVFSAFR